MTIQSPAASTPTDSRSTFRPTKFPPSAAAAAASARFELGEADEEECVVVCGAEAEVREVLSRTPAQKAPSTSAEHAWTGTPGLSPFAQLGDFHGRPTVTLANPNALAHASVIYTPPWPLSQLRGSAATLWQVSACSDDLQRYSSASAELDREREAILLRCSPASAARLSPRPKTPGQSSSMQPSPLQHDRPVAAKGSPSDAAQRASPLGPLGRKRRSSPGPDASVLSPRVPPQPVVASAAAVLQARPHNTTLAMFETPYGLLGDGGAGGGGGGIKRGKPTRCRCDRSRCLKRFCVCFAAGVTCAPDCKCKGCGNDVSAHEARGGDARAEDAAKVRGCNCRKSECRKRYCECFQVGESCHEKCRCLDCANPAGVRDPAAQARDAAAAVAAMQMRHVCPVGV